MVCPFNLPNTCCGCCPLHIGYTYIVYCDLLKILLSVFYIITKASQPDVEAYVIIVTSFIVLLTCLQAGAAYFSLWRGFPKNDWKKHFIYTISKTINLVLVIPGVTVLNYLSCIAPTNTKIHCHEVNGSFEIIWGILEIYLLFLVAIVCRKTYKEEYGPIGSSPIFAISIEPDPLRSSLPAITIEVKGEKAFKSLNNKTMTQSTQTIGGSTMDGKEMEIEIYIKMAKQDSHEAEDTLIPVSIPIYQEEKRRDKIKRKRLDELEKVERVDLIGLKII